MPARGQLCLRLGDLRLGLGHPLGLGRRCDPRQLGLGGVQRRLRLLRLRLQLGAVQPHQPLARRHGVPFECVHFGHSPAQLGADRRLLPFDDTGGLDRAGRRLPWVSASAG